MQIQGTGYVHGPQKINAPHNAPPGGPAAEPAQGNLHVDQLDISAEADLVSRAREVSDVRQDRVDTIRAEIAAGTYETDEKLDLAVSRLLDELA